MVNSEDGVDFAMLLALRAPRLRSVGKAGKLQILENKRVTSQILNIRIQHLNLLCDPLVPPNT